MQENNNNNRSGIAGNFISCVVVMIWIDLLDKCLSTKYVPLLPCLEIS